MSPLAWLRQGASECRCFNRNRQQLRVGVEGAPFLGDHTADQGGTVQRLLHAPQQGQAGCQGPEEKSALGVGLLVGVGCPGRRSRRGR